MTTIALLALFISYILSPSSPITWALLAVTLAALTYESMQLSKKFKELA